MVFSAPCGRRKCDSMQLLCRRECSCGAGLATQVLERMHTTRAVVRHRASPGGTNAGDGEIIYAVSNVY